MLPIIITAQCVSLSVMLVSTVLFSNLGRLIDMTNIIWPIILLFSVISFLFSSFVLYLEIRLLRANDIDSCERKIIYCAAVSVFFSFLSWVYALILGIDHLALVMMIAASTLSMIIELSTATHFVTKLNI